MWTNTSSCVTSSRMTWVDSVQKEKRANTVEITIFCLSSNIALSNFILFPLWGLSYLLASEMASIFNNARKPSKYLWETRTNQFSNFPNILRINHSSISLYDFDYKFNCFRYLSIVGSCFFVVRQQAYQFMLIYFALIGWIPTWRGSSLYNSWCCHR